MISNWNYVVIFFSLLIFQSISVVVYFVTKNSEMVELQKYVDVRCSSIKNDTNFEIRGGTSIFYSLHRLIYLSNTPTPGDIWYNFATNVTFNSKWRYIGSGVLMEFNSTSLKEWGLEKNVTVTERNNVTNTRAPVTYDRDKYLVIVENFPRRTSVGFDYYSDPERNKMVEKAKEIKQITVSDPAEAINSPDKTVIFFIPLYNTTTNIFLGGVSGAYSMKDMVPRAEERPDIFIQYSINNIVGYTEDNFNKNTVLFSLVEFDIADKKATMECTTDRMVSVIPIVFLLIGTGISILTTGFFTAIFIINDKKNKTILKNMEIEQKADEAFAIAKNKSEFLFTMSHEIRTPLNGILWMMNFLMNTKLTIEQEDYINTLQISSQSLLQIVNDILDISKMEAGKLEIESISINIIDILKKLVVTYEYLAQKNNNKFLLNIQMDECYIMGDSRRIIQVINNLATNALKFTNNGSVTLNFYIKDENYIYFEVKDTGIGMNEEQLLKIFKPFQQANIDISKKYGGTGLGLMICKNLVNLMNGSIGVSSEYSIGSTFWFCLPYIKGAKIYDVVDIQKILFDGNVLVAEDNMVNQKIMKKLLIEQYGLKVTIANNGQEVIDLVENNEFDCIFMDGIMPILDGYETSKLLREKNYNMPIIACTANAMKGECEKCIECGMSDFISKPIEKSELTRVILKYLRPK